MLDQRVDQTGEGMRPGVDRVGKVAARRRKSARANTGDDRPSESGEVALFARIDAAAGSLSIEASDPSGAKSTAQVAIDVARLGWTDTVTWTASEGPEAREHATVFADDSTGSIYVLFGSGYAPYGEPLGDGYRFDPSTRTWSARSRGPASVERDDQPLANGDAPVHAIGQIEIMGRDQRR